MTGKTHRQYAICFGLLANIWLYKTGLTSVNYFIALPIILMTSKCGALFPDVDHAWVNVKDKTVVNFIINKIIHLTGGTHRSWQTHSIDIVIWFTAIAFVAPTELYNMGYIDIVNKELLSIILLGFSAGWISHIISDMLTSAGVRILCFSKTKVALVPKHIGNLRFNTGNEWEDFCRKATRVINVALGIYTIFYPFEVYKMLVPR